MATNSHARLPALGLLVAITLLAFWPLLGHEFDEYDDVKYVTRNRHVQEGLTPGSVAWAFTSFEASNWHPLTWLSHMLDWEIFGPNPRGHHAVSLLLHVTNVCLLFLALEIATRETWRSAAVAALFAVHPLHVESVAWVAERKDLLSTLFWLLAILAYLKRARAPRPGSMGPVAAFMALGLMSKPMLVTLPLTLLLLDTWPLGRLTVLSDLRPLVREKIPLFALSVASCVVTLVAQRRAIGSFERFPLASRIENALVSCVAYLGKTLWPADLSVFYPYPSGSIPAWKAAGAALILLVVTTLAVRFRRRYPYVLTGWRWYVATLVPVIGIVQVGRQAMADRYTYVPLIGVFVIAVWGAAELLPARWAALPAAVVLLALVVTTRVTLRPWHDAVALFQHAAAVAESAVARTNLGEALLNRGRPAEAEEQFRAALRLDPSIHEAENSLGLILERAGRNDEALTHYEAAVRLSPAYATAHRNFGRLLGRVNRLDEAIGHDEAALALNPNDAESHANLALALTTKGRPAEAVSHYEAALAATPDSPELHNNLGSALSRLGRNEEALRQFAEAVRLRPGYGTAHFNLAAAMYLTGRYPDAWREVRAAQRTGYDPPRSFLDLLAAKMLEPATE
jgi:tetratricopeptide (TPR) repeat protein